MNFWLTILFNGFILLSILPVTARSIVTRIVGGQSTNILKYPFMVSIQKKAFGHICGGTYIREIYVLSVAHCFVTINEAGNYKVQNPLLFIAIAGATDVTSSYVSSMQTRLVLHIEVHPNYNSSSQFNDIALIRLDRPFTPSMEVLRVNLPSTNIVDDILLATNRSEDLILCQIVGWGYLTEASPSGHGKSLMMARVPLLDHKNCSNWYSENRQYHYSRKLQICAGFQEGSVDACQGDSGGPLICNGQQIGIVSFGEGCGRRERPGLYTRLDIYLDWIKEVSSFNGRSISSANNSNVQHFLLFINYLIFLIFFIYNQAIF